MFKSENKVIATLFMEKFISINQKYPIRSSERKFQLPKQKLKTTDYAILSKSDVSETKVLITN